MNYFKRQYVPPQVARAAEVCPHKAKLVDQITASVDMDSLGRPDTPANPVQDAGPFQEKAKKVRRKRASV